MISKLKTFKGTVAPDLKAFLLPTISYLYFLRGR
jgi:hypothetical protein